MATLAAALDRFGLADGQVISFHHHYRNGERTMEPVLRLAQARGVRGLTLAASSLFPCHAGLIPFLEDGTVTQIVTDYMRGPLADAVQAGRLAGKAVLQSHGARARAIASGALDVDLAVVAAPLALAGGATTGRGGQLACGPLGYPAVDAAHARATIVLADEITADPLPRTDIPGHFVDAVLPFPAPGTPDGIASGTTVPLDTPQARALGALVAEIIAAAGLMRDGMSLQSGAGGYSLGSVPVIGQRMAAAGVRGGFLSGGITGAHVALLEAGLFREIWDVQCFDRDAVASSIRTAAHRMMSAAEYASPLHPDAVVDRLDVMLLGAVEVDHAFNVNVAASAEGQILGGPGGHPDAAQGAKLSIVTTALQGGGQPKVVPQVRCVTTEGCDVDVVVTDRGYAVNPRREDLRAALRGLSAPMLSIEDLSRMAADGLPPAPRPAQPTGHILVEHRLGHLLDVI
ncbi:MAG: citrate CoA-transferase [Rhodobacteraceae bacterium]|nr:citrate CoA-transferase [Paracoccaceae bacterium]